MIDVAIWIGIAVAVTGGLASFGAFGPRAKPIGRGAIVFGLIIAGIALGKRFRALALLPVIAWEKEARLEAARLDAADADKRAKAAALAGQGIEAAARAREAAREVARLEEERDEAVRAARAPTDLDLRVDRWNKRRGG